MRQHAISPASLNRQQVDELSRSNRQLTEFARVVSHDLKGPLQGVLLYSRTLEDRCWQKFDDEERLQLQYITETTKGLVALIEGLLSYALVSSADLEAPAALDITTVLRVALSNLSAQIIEANALVTYESLPTVCVGATQILQLMQNLIANGIKYRREVRPEIHVSATMTAGHWLFSVRDNGVGIESQYFDRIFKPFKRLYGSDRPGSGLGLSICKGIVENLGGRIWVESEVGKGSTFLFTIAG